MSTTIYSANYHPSSISLFHDSDGYYHLIYMIVNKINNKIYIGKHSTKNPHDSYMGSGKAINRSIKKYGLENFEKTILYCFDSEDEAYLKESEIVDENFVKRSDTYNMKCGGKGFNSVDVKGKNNPMFNKSPVNKGISMSKQQKLKISNALKGKYTGANSSVGKLVIKTDYKGNIIQEYYTILDAFHSTNLKGFSNFYYRYLKGHKPYKGFYYILKEEYK